MRTFASCRDLIGRKFGLDQELDVMIAAPRDITYIPVNDHFHWWAQMDVSFHPLLTNLGLPSAVGSESSATESWLIQDYLRSLPSTLHAQEGYKLLLDYYQETKSKRVDTRAELYVIERLLLWCFSVKQISLRILTVVDVAEFIDFLIAPPGDWLGTRGAKRFVAERGVSRSNPMWRPCSTSVVDYERVRFTLNKFLRFGSGVVGLVMRPPPAKKNTVRQCCCQNAEKIALEYIKRLEQYRPGRAASERGLFLFATSFYLRISHGELAKYCDEFGMRCFLLTAAGGGSFKLATSTGMLERELPISYMKFFFRWRQYLGLSKYPQSTEPHAMFTRRALVNFTCELPDLSPDSYPPTQILKSLFSICVVCKRKTKAEQIVKIEASARFRKRVSDKQQTHRAFQEIFLVAKENLPSFPVTPAPLFSMSSRSFTPLSTLIRVNILVELNKALDVDVCRDAVSFFDVLAGLDSSRLKLMAFEKLTLWALLILKKNAADLSEHEVEQFYVFCLNPPSEWVVQGRALRDNGLYGGPKFRINQTWRPFYRGVPDKATQVARVGRIIGWCNSCFVTLVRAGYMRNNPFSNFHKYIN